METPESAANSSRPIPNIQPLKANGFGSLKKTARIPQVDKLKEIVTEPEPKAVEDAVDPEMPTDEVQPIDPENLKNVWMKFARKKKDEGRDHLFMLLNQPYQYENELVTLTLTSPLQEDLINDFRTEIVQYLRKELKNKNVSIATKVVKPDSKKMIYTPLEKFNYLAEKHPALLALKETLGLDPEF